MSRKLYVIVSIFQRANLGIETVASTEIGLYDSEIEAANDGVESAAKRHPRKDGWKVSSFEAYLVPDDLLREACNGLPQQPMA